MPELPEVETILRGLRPALKKQRIRKAVLSLARLSPETPTPLLTKRLKGQTVEEVARRGKYLLIHLETHTLIVHLGMTGQLTYAPSDAPSTQTFHRTLTGMEISAGVHKPDKHTHFILSFESGDRLLFRDVRTFGKLFLVSKAGWQHHPRIQKLGPEPLEIQPSTFIALILSANGKTGAKTRRVKSRNIKSLLLEQNFLAGVGNIYADECLFLSKIHPETPGRVLGKKQWRTLLKNLQTVLRAGIDNFGTTLRDYRRPDASKGRHQERLKVYGRAGKPCLRCRTLLVKTVVAQRGTTFCPVCQPLTPTPSHGINA